MSNSYRNAAATLVTGFALGVAVRHLAGASREQERQAKAAEATARLEEAAAGAEGARIAWNTAKGAAATSATPAASSLAVCQGPTDGASTEQPASRAAGEALSLCSDVGFKELSLQDMLELYTAAACRATGAAAVNVFFVDTAGKNLWCPGWYDTPDRGDDQAEADPLMLHVGAQCASAVRD